MEFVLPLAVVSILGLIWAWRMERVRRRTLESEAAREARRWTEELAEWRGRATALESASRASADLLIAVDEALLVVYANPAAHERFGNPLEGQPLVTYAGSPQVGDLARDSLEVQDPQGIERTLRLQDRPYRARAVRTAVGVGIWLEDVGELERLTRARQDLIANLSHELRTPLSALRLLADTFVAKPGQDPRTARELAGRMSAEVDTLNQMAQEMLDLSALESGRQVVRLIPVSLREVVDLAIGHLTGEAGRRGIRIRIDVAPEIRVLGDIEQAARAVQNVLHNAIKFSPEGSQVSLAAGPEDPDQVALHIADEGPGISPAELSRIFERFYRGDQSRGTPGTGLGLSIAHHILRAHGGHIWAENRRPPERGAIFSLSFPAA